ncbi:hypothetical protein SUGI_0032630 [Cryptomeria japonica]|nr:hypothetical protein SUGI_0032630 [Cryptomeria japonica]
MGRGRNGFSEQNCHSNTRNWFNLPTISLIALNGYLLKGNGEIWDDRRQDISQSGIDMDNWFLPAMVEAARIPQLMHLNSRVSSTLDQAWKQPKVWRGSGKSNQKRSYFNMQGRYHYFAKPLLHPDKSWPHNSWGNQGMPPAINNVNKVQKQVGRSSYESPTAEASGVYDGPN